MRGGYEIALFCPILVATATDLLWGKIFNWLTFPFLLTGLIARLVLGGFADLSQGLIAIAIAFALFFPLYVVRAIAAGDAKLLMAMAAWTDSRTIIEVAAIAIVIGAAVGLISLLRQKGFRGSVQSVAENVAQGSAHGQLAEDALWTRILVRVLGGEYRPVSALGAFVKRGKRRLGNERGQTTLEYMLLLATTFIVSYLVITGPHVPVHPADAGHDP